MVKIKITKAEYPNETGYVGGIYEAFVMDYGCGIEYAAHVDKDKMMIIRAENCEVVVDETEEAAQSNQDIKETKNTTTPKILLVEDGSVDTDDLEEWAKDNDNNIKIVIYRKGANKPEFLKD